MKRPIKATGARGRAWRAIAEGAPDLMDDVDFAARNVRKVAARPVQREKKEVQRPVVTYLRRHLPAGSVVYAITNHARSREQVFALLRDGMQPGMPDVGIIIPTGPVRVAFIECKAPDGGSLSDKQEHTQALLTAAGVAVLAECRSVAEAVDWLLAQGVQLR